MTALFAVLMTSVHQLLQCIAEGCRWGLLSFLVYSIFALAGHAEKYWLVAFNISIVIAFGVMGLSFLRCSLLQDALVELGGGFFLIGNFMVHYYPPLRLWYSRPTPTRTSKQITFSLVWIAVYLSSQQAADVYGCAVSDRTIVIASLLCVPITLAVSFAAATSENQRYVYTNTVRTLAIPIAGILAGKRALLESYDDGAVDNAT